MTDTTLSPALARRLALQHQLFRATPKLARGIEGTMQTIEHLGYIQIDTISVIQRAHHHTLWTRRSDYSLSLLHRLQAVDRRVFEFWGHALSLLPMQDYRYYLPRMARFRDPENKWFTVKRRLCGKLMQPVMERIRAEGPLGAKDFDHKRMEGVWAAKPTTGALEILFFCGELMITERRGMERVYDLTERVLSDHIDTTTPTDDELGRFLINRAIRAHGIVTERDIREHIDAAENGVISETLASMLEEKSVVPVTIEGLDKQQYYCSPDTLATAGRLREQKPAVHLLSPFDNLVILRDRLSRLFEFDYRIECYTPAPKRKYGYFVLPILFGERMVGRLDPKADRKENMLIIRKLWLEDSSVDLDLFVPMLADKLRKLAAFVEVDHVKIERTTPAGLKAKLQRLLK